MKKLMTFLMLILAFSAFAQKQPFNLAAPSESGGGGNGGDYVRMKFIEVGNFVLKNYKGGLKEIESVVTLDALRLTLDIRVIKLSSEPLIDNGGSRVDAIGVPGSIILYEGNELQRTGWYGIFQKTELVEKLVLHEMLRAAGVNDDNYVYSTIVLTKYDLSQFDNSAYIRWCSETASFVESALKQGLSAKTYKQELVFYEKALAQVESLISPKNFSFIAPSVKGTLRIAPLFKTDKNRVNFFKLALRQIANDIRYVDKQLRSKQSAAVMNLGDNSQYALSYINSASKFTILAETADIEENILNVVFEQVYAYMVNSDYSRQKYGALFAELDSARNTPILSYKRQALQYMATLLK